MHVIALTVTDRILLEQLGYLDGKLVRRDRGDWRHDFLVACGTPVGARARRGRGIGCTNYLDTLGT
jgi:hypothetical protein